MITRFNPHFKSLILILIFTGIGFYIGQSNLLNLPNTNNKSSVNKPTLEGSPLIQYQSSMIFGKITKIDNRTVTVSKDNVSDIFLLSNNLLINKPSADPRYAASTSADIKSIELNKDANISVEVRNNHYEVVSISYINTTASPGPLNPKLSSPSATMRPSK